MPLRRAAGPYRGTERSIATAPRELSDHHRSVPGPRSAVKPEPPSGPDYRPHRVRRRREAARRQDGPAARCRRRQPARDGAAFRGSLPGRGVHTDDVVGIAAEFLNGTAGYWLVGSDGGVFDFGLNYGGSLPGDHITVHDIVAVTPAYYLIGADGGVFNMQPGFLRFCGSAAGDTTAPIVAGVADPETLGAGGYWLLGRDGSLFAYGAPDDGTVSAARQRSTPCL
jgi:hypothetical protein